MKKLRDFYFIACLAALAFALLTKHIKGITVTDFVQGFCYGLAFTMFIAGLITSVIPCFYRIDGKKKHAEEINPELEDATAATDHESGKSETAGNV